MKTNRIHILLLFIVLLFLEACGTGGYLVSRDQVAKIKVGESTKQDVRKILGEPLKVSTPKESGAEFESWVYPYAKYASDPYTGVPPIGVVGAPISRARRKTTELEIVFDDQGVVSAMNESRPKQ